MIQKIQENLLQKKNEESDTQLLTSVNVCVLLHVRFLVEPLATELAGVGPGVRVDEEVRGQSGGALERLAAHFALKAFFLKHGHSRWFLRVNLHHNGVILSPAPKRFSNEPVYFHFLF